MSRDRELRRMAAEASTLWERLHGEYVPEDGEESRILARRRLERWRAKAADGDPARFATRLGWLGTTVDEVEPRLGTVRLTGALPAWTELFVAAMDAATPAGRGPRTTRHPFGDLLHPFVVAARARLSSACGEELTGPALDALADDLLGSLSHVAAPTLYLELSVFRTTEGPSQGGTALYDAFVSRLLAGGLWPFFHEYGVLARLLSTVAELWAQNTSALAEALRADRVKIEEVFGGPKGRIATVRPSLSDPHDGGRTVTLVRFEDGSSLVHKPRNLGVEEAWFELLRFLNAHGTDLQTLQVLDRGDRGWAEVVRHAPCRDAAEARDYYRRSGSLLAVLYTLEASDCFYENVVACGGHPVMVDLETLMHHVLRQAGDLAPAEEAADDILFDSVFRAGFLPTWETSPDGLSVDISGLGARPGQATPYRMRRWTAVNTDAMELHHEPVRVDTADHLPALGGHSLRAADHAEEVVAGFRSTYRRLLDLREELGAPAGPLDVLGTREIRVVLHASRVYGLLLKRLYTPRHLRNGVERSLEIDLLSRFYLDSREKAAVWPVLHAEIDALERLDLPRFAVRGDGRHLPLPTGGVLENAFQESGVERVRRRLAAMGPADLELQTGFIRASLHLSAVSVLHEAGDGSPEPEAADGSTLGRDELLGEARALAAELAERAIEADGTVTWIAPQLLPRASHHELRPLRMDLYNGLAGVALFFAAQERVLGTGRELALAALAPLRRFAATADARRMARAGYTLGAATGAGSFLYALTRCATLLDEPALLDDAMLLAGRVTPEWIAADEHLDVTSGAAGAVLGLLALHRATGDPAVLATAARCGEHLLARREPAGPGWAWRSGPGPCLTGLSHGAAGIALALLRLAEATGDDRFRAGAADAIAYEDSVYDAAEGNWPDFRRGAGESPAFMATWCHGAPGIGLARAAGLPVLDSPDVRRAIESAVATVERSGITDRDGLCCGNLGRAELYLAASTAGGNGALECRALAVASGVVARARRAGGYRLSGRPRGDFFDPSLFQGLAGIGYQLLRIAAPERLPSVLVWE